MTRSTDRGAAEAARHGAARSNRWRTVARKFLAENPSCAVCGRAGDEVQLQVHHVVPYHYCTDQRIARPDLELDPRNLIALCEHTSSRPAADHHLVVGHLDDFRSSNLHVREDFELNGDPASVMASPLWLARRAARMPALDAMTEADLQALRDRIAEVYGAEPVVSCTRTTRRSRPNKRASRTP